MEHFILNGKIITLEKNKDTALPIPVMFNVESDEFILEIPEEQLQKNMVIELNISSTTRESIRKIPVTMESKIRKFRMIDFTGVELKSYMLYSCKSNQPVRLSISILSNK